MKAFLLPLLIAIGTPALHAATIVNVSFTADGSSRFYDYFYNVYAQVGTGTSLFAIANGGTGPPTGGSIPAIAGEQVGTAVVFPTAGNWSNVGSFTLGGTATGVGIETFTIAGAAFNFSQYVNYEGSALAEAFGDYTTQFYPSSTGMIQLTDGVVTDLSFTGDLVFDYGSGAFLFPGTLEIDENGFDLDAAGGDPFSFNHRWDATGSSSFAPVPEPSVAMMLGMLAGAAALRRRRH